MENITNSLKIYFNQFNSFRSTSYEQALSDGGKKKLPFQQEENWQNHAQGGVTMFTNVTCNIPEKEMSLSDFSTDWNVKGFCISVN